MADLPGEVTSFLAEHVDSLEQLEILLLLRASPRREFTAAEVTAELRLGAGSDRRLEDLRARGFLAASGDPPAYRYAADGTSAGIIDRVAHCYARYRVAVISFIFSPRGDAAIRGLADAFKLRRK